MISVRQLSILFVLLLQYSFSLHAQKMSVDSLLNVTRTAKVDSVRVNAFISLSLEYRKKGKLDSAMLMAENARVLAERTDFRRGVGRSVYYKGVVHMIRGEYDTALSYFRVASDTFQSIGDLSNYANIQIATGGVYTLLGDQETAIDYQLKALGTKQKLKDTLGIAASYNNIANIYHSMGELDTALVYFLKALAIHEKGDDGYKLADDYYNVGNTYYNSGQDSLARIYLRKSLHFADSLDYIEIRTYSYGTIASMYVKNGDLDSAEYYYRQAMAIAEEMSDEHMLAVNNLQMANLYVKKKQYPVAEKYYRSALRCAYSLGDIEQLREITAPFSEYFSEIGKYDSALVYYKAYISYRDSISSADVQSEILRKKLLFEFETQKEIDRAEQDAKDAITDARLQQQKVWIGLGSVVLLLVIAFAWFLFNRAQVTRKQNVLIQQQKLEVERQRDQVELQKHEIEEKNKSITDSITYARRIQSAILPQPEHVRNVLRDAFVFYQPKDIVSGDFFWISETPEYIFYATVDCTGHGVPGGFMSIMGASLLNEIVNDHQVCEPSDVLNQMRSKVIAALRQTGESGENKDGMDMVLCRIDKKLSTLAFAAANNPLWLCRNGVIEEFAPDKQPVGIGATAAIEFRGHTIALQKGDVIYTITDGFADQFGGDKGKKFKYKPLRQLLETNSALSMNEQHDLLQKTFVDWKGNLEQVDDVLVIGVRI